MHERGKDDSVCADAERADGHPVGRGTPYLKVEVSTDRGATWATNGLRFINHDHAHAYAQDLEMRWLAVTDWRVVDADDDLPCVVIRDGELVPLQRFLSPEEIAQREDNQ